jgi:hypothetical protein
MARTRGPLWERYLDVVSESVGVPRERLRPDADFVDDLRLDRGHRAASPNESLKLTKARSVPRRQHGSSPAPRSLALALGSTQ